MRYVHLKKSQTYSLETNPSSHRGCYMRTMTARVQLKKEISRPDPQGALLQDELIGGIPPVAK
jgi:hypothetical protein